VFSLLFPQATNPPAIAMMARNFFIVLFKYLVN
jgi:hypothetical protein